jgi:hypothetical protein
MYQLFEVYNGKLTHLENFGNYDDAKAKAISEKKNWLETMGQSRYFEVHFNGQCAFRI